MDPQRPPLPPPAPPPGSPREGVLRPACIPSEALFAGAAEVQIEHRGTLYRLRKTSLGKLILTK